MTGRYVIRGGEIATMDEQLGDLRGDVLVSDGLIEAIGENLSPEVVGDAEVIDATDCVVIPGFVDAHRHLWQTSFRGMLPNCTLPDYMRDVLGRIGSSISAQDGYVGNLLGALECINGGITTVFDWSHALANPEDSDARIDALRDSGIRGYFAPSTPATAAYFSWDEPVQHPDDIRRLATVLEGDGRLRLGAALRSPGQIPDSVLPGDWQLAREVGAFISIHAGARPGRTPSEVRTLDDLGLLGPDINYAHGNEFDDDDLARVRDSGGSIAVSPYAEMAGGHGRVPMLRMLAQGVVPALSADATIVAPGDMFSEMRMLFASTRADEQPDDPRQAFEPTYTVRAALECATIHGARAIGLGDVTGSLTVGKAADIVLVRGDQLNTAPIVDPIGTVVQCAETGNVDTVLIGGEILKRDGHLVGQDVPALLDGAKASRARVLREAGFPGW